MSTEYSRHVYVVGPDKDLLEQFVGKHFTEQYRDTPDIIKMSTEMIDPTDALSIYVLYNNDNDWLYHYTMSKLDKVVLVKDF